VNGDKIKHGDLKPLNKDELNGIKIAAFICRMYCDGEKWASVIELYGEQQRARYYMAKEI